MNPIIWTPVAKRSLQQTVDFISEVWNEKIVDVFLTELDSRIVQIQANPELAKRLENTEFRQLSVHRTVSLFYQNYSDHTKILLVWDNRQNSSKLIQNLT
ncbi:MAG: type II toxin-antitoxin system RelE/ParE family toxin [Flavobacteriales bacterium]|jgi:plasmid stabilization system protein ParE|nr:type II toxin-antitoxin system RelE/ParE family toxin [Flavobacteriales bacterium]